MLRTLTPLKRTTRLRPVSAKRARANREYSQRRRQYLIDHPFCAVMLARFGISEAIAKWYGGEVPVTGDLVGTLHVPISTEIHHTRKPRCKYLNDESTWMAVSREGHEWIENNNSQARAKGWLF